MVGFKDTSLETAGALCKKYGVDDRDSKLYQGSHSSENN